MLCLPSSSSITAGAAFFSKTLFHFHPNSRTIFATMSLRTHAFAGNPIKLITPKSTDPVSPQSALQALRTLLSSSGQTTHQSVSTEFKVLPFRKGRPLTGLSADGPRWHIGWLTLGECKSFLEKSGVGLSDESLVYLGCKSEEDVVYWAIDVSEESGLVNELGAKQLCFVELRTLMVATDWADSIAMADLAIAGHLLNMHYYSRGVGYHLPCSCLSDHLTSTIIFYQARALLEWHNVARFCGYCGEKTVPIEAGRRKQCSNELCKKRIYPRVDPVVIMLVIDKENDRVLLSRQSRFVPRMWSCLAGFIEPGESLEEAVRRETLEEAGIEVGEVVYHSSQPWPVGPSSMPCQIMVGFFAYAKSLNINVDKEELEDAKWHSRDEVEKALTFAEYKKAQETAAAKVEQMCKGVEKGHSLLTDFNVESGELAPMFIPGPFAIAHHLISSWVNRTAPTGINTAQKQTTPSALSNL